MAYQKPMIDHKKKQAEDNKKIVYSVVKDQNIPITSIDVHKYISKKISNDVKIEFQDLIVQGRIPSANNEKYWRNMLKKRLMTLRTVQRQLRVLNEEGYLVCKSRKYALSSMEYPEIKLWAKEFGASVLYSAMKRIYPKYSRLEYNFPRLVEIFGVYLVYSFLEAAKPIINKNGKKIPGERRDHLALSWIENALNPKEMFYYFIAYLKSQPSDEEVRKTRKKIFRKRNKNFIFRGTREELIGHLSKLTSRNVAYPLDPKHKKESKANQERSIIETNCATIEKLKKFLQEKYSLTYLQMEDSYNVFKVKNKEGFISSGPIYDFTYDDYRINLWNSDLLEKVKIWDNDLIVEK